MMGRRPQPVRKASVAPRFCYGSLAGNQTLTGGLWPERSEANFGQASANFSQASV